MYISRPPISVSSGDQLQKKNTNSQAQKPTTVMVRDRDDMVRHPVTKKFTSKWQNEQADNSFADEADEIGKKDDGRGSSWKKNDV